MADTKDQLVALLNEQFDAIVEAWIATQKDEGVRRSDLFSAKETRAQTVRLLTAFRNGVAEAETGEDLDLRADEWAELRETLSDLGRERVERGMTPTEMATFVAALKSPLFHSLRERMAGSPDALIEEVWHITRIVDAFALYTTEVFIAERELVIERQRTEMLELSTPVVQLWDDILALPLIGTMDSVRAQDVMENLLEAIVERKAEIVIIDITGVQTVDTQVAQHLLRTAAAVRLMGAECVISGISPRIAQTMVQLGVDVGEVVTSGSIQNALTYAFRKVGVRIAAEETPKGSRV
ncbi:STAS domain-containing protein [Parvularcula oceani]|uniref:STAS domain-containing protein n=1 Tax=Parvularcula oceani TaxID=1247963 RepID=UPI0004E224C7|nr:STAS domain-containing protein [Parvularcula oceani]